METNWAIGPEYKPPSFVAGCKVREDREKNISILKTLVTDDSPAVQLSAAASLVSLNDPGGRKVILDALDSKQDHELRQALQQLARVKDSTQRSFAETRIKAIAADRQLNEHTRRAADKLLSSKPKP